MVKITYEPATDLVVHEVIFMPQDDLLRERVTPSGTIPLCWCEGVLFTFTSVPMTEDVLKDYLN